MFWERVAAILVGWLVLPPLAWVLAHEVLRFIRSMAYRAGSAPRTLQTPKVDAPHLGRWSRLSTFQI